MKIVQFEEEEHVELRPQQPEEVLVYEELVYSRTKGELEEV